MLNSQERYDTLVSVNDTLIIGEASAANYKHIDIPKKNIIIKRGGIADFTNFANTKVTVKEIVTDQNGATKVVLKRLNNRRFFKVFSTLKADLNMAINSGELRLPPSNKEELAK